MREDWPERPEMEDMRRVVDLYVRGHLPADLLTRETRRFAFTCNVVAPVRRWFATLRTRRKQAEDESTAAAPEVELSIHRVAR